MPRITIQMFEGRTLEQKRAISKRITDIMIEEANAKKEDITIVYTDMKRDDYAKGGVMKCDM